MCHAPLLFRCHVTNGHSHLPAMTHSVEGAYLVVPSLSPGEWSSIFKVRDNVFRATFLLLPNCAAPPAEVSIQTYPQMISPPPLIHRYSLMHPVSQSQSILYHYSGYVNCLLFFDILSFFQNGLNSLRVL